MRTWGREEIWPRGPVSAQSLPHHQRHSAAGAPGPESRATVSRSETRLRRPLTLSRPRLRSVCWWGRNCHSSPPKRTPHCCGVRLGGENGTNGPSNLLTSRGIVRSDPRTPLSDTHCASTGRAGPARPLRDEVEDISPLPLVLVVPHDLTDQRFRIAVRTEVVVVDLAHLG